jgi:signal recognition particle subunit SRP54
MGMIPGVGKQLKDTDIDENAFTGVESIILSMSPDERTNPQIINGSRKQRIAKGSGSSIQEVNKLMKQFDETKKMMQMMNNKKGMTQMMKQFKQMQKGGGMPM